MDCKIQSNFKIEQTEVDVEYPGADSSAIETFTEGQVFDQKDSKPQLGIKIEQPKVDLECSDAHCSTKETAAEGQTVDKMDILVPAAVKTEQPKVYLDYAEILPSSQSYPSITTQEHPQTEMFDTTDFKPVNQKLTGALCGDKTDRFSNILDMVISSSVHEMTRNSSVDPTKAESDYSVLFNLENCDHSSENVSALTEVTKNLSLNNENSQIYTMETEVNDTHISRGSLDSNLDSASSMRPNKQIAYLSDGSDPSSNVEKETQHAEKPYKQHNAWWSQECTEAKDKRKRALQKYRRLRTIENRGEYTALRNATNRIVRKAKEAHLKTLCQKLNPATPATEV